MKAFADFILEVALPPNPIRSLDNSLTGPQANGRNIFFNRPAPTPSPPATAATRSIPAQGFFGTDGRTTFENETQEFKVAHLRNAYQKVGMFGMPTIAVHQRPAATAGIQGDQVRGFGFLHDGSIATVFDFLHATVFSLNDDASGATSSSSFSPSTRPSRRSSASR